MSNRFVQVSVTCACCGTVRGESNHWYRLMTPNDKSVLSYAGLEMLYMVLPLQGAPDSENDFPVCGRECLQKLESQLLSGKKLV